MITVTKKIQEAEVLDGLFCQVISAAEAWLEFHGIAYLDNVNERLLPDLLTYFLLETGYRIDGVCPWCYAILYAGEDNCCFCEDCDSGNCVHTKDPSLVREVVAHQLDEQGMLDITKEQEMWRFPVMTPGRVMIPALLPSYDHDSWLDFIGAIGSLYVAGWPPRVASEIIERVTALINAVDKRDPDEVFIALIMLLALQHGGEVSLVGDWGDLFNEFAPILCPPDWYGDDQDFNRWVAETAHNNGLQSLFTDKAIDEFRLCLNIEFGTPFREWPRVLQESIERLEPIIGLAKEFKEFLNKNK